MPAKSHSSLPVVGVDVSPQMLEVACAVAPAVDWREGDACALPLRVGERYDVAVRIARRSWDD
jgi:ubiquinone/menaquinone biosynthesis C-methylase UbiE